MRASLARRSVATRARARAYPLVEDEGERAAEAAARARDEDGAVAHVEAALLLRARHAAACNEVSGARLRQAASASRAVASHLQSNL